MSHESQSSASQVHQSQSESQQNIELSDVETQALIKRWQAVLEQVEQVAKGQPQQVGLLAVSKTKPASMVQVLAEAGQVDFGENYLQEALDKIQILQTQQQPQPITWHYIGHIQRNKTRDIAENFAWVHTIERDIIAKRLNNQRPENLPPLNVLIQVNIDAEDSKSGCLPEEVEALVCSIKEYPKLCLRGLMIIPAKEDTQAFARTQALFHTIKSKYPELSAWDTLSMGMSGDMIDAIAHGSTMVRVGTAIFGARD